MSRYNPKRRKTIDILRQKPVAERRAIAMASSDPQAMAAALRIAAPGPAKEVVERRVYKRSGKPRPRIGTLVFDSETERTVYAHLRDSHAAVLAHGCIPLGPTRHLEPDFVLVHEVLPDGRFVGELVDAKAVWEPDGAPHMERDWAVKRDWLLHQYGLTLRVITPEESHAALRSAGQRRSARNRAEGGAA